MFPSNYSLAIVLMSAIKLDGWWADNPIEVRIGMNGGAVCQVGIFTDKSSPT